MNRLMFCGALLLVSASAASAAGLNLAWDACYLDGGFALRTFPCNSDLGTGTRANNLALSLTPAADIAQFQGVVATVTVTTYGPLPSWWSGACAARPSAAIFGVSGATSACSNSAYGPVTPSGGVTAVRNYWGGINPTLVEFTLAVAPGKETNLLANTEYFLGRLQMSNVATTGAGACIGCLYPACIRFTSAVVVRAGLPNPIAAIITQPEYQPLVHWQAATGNPYLCVIIPPPPTPARNASWGAIKGLYR
jgi:hypothetical protein